MRHEFILFLFYPYSQVHNIVDKACKELAMEKMIKDLEVSWKTLEFDHETHKVGRFMLNETHKAGRSLFDSSSSENGKYFAEDFRRAHRNSRRKPGH